MGVRISAYAVNLVEFEPVLDGSLARQLQFFHRSAPPDGRARSWSRQVGIADDRTTVRNFLQTEWSPMLDGFLSSLAECGCDGVLMRITSGGRRWWIGSLLQGARQVLGAHSEMYLRLESVLARTLRVYGCGLDIPQFTYCLSDVCFPVIPFEDASHWMATWTSDELQHVVQCFRILAAGQLAFTQPPLPTGISEPDWDAWVREMMNEFVSIGEQPYESCCVVTFIDS